MRRGRVLLLALALLGLAPPAWADITSNLAAHWACDENTGTTCADTSGNANTATFVNSAAFTTSAKVGPAALALALASSDYASVPDAASLDMAGEVTVAGWVYITSVAAGEQTLVSKSSCVPTCATNYGFAVTATGTLKFYFTNPDGTYHEFASTASQVSNTTWTHIAVTYKLSTTTIVLYANGTAVGGTATGSPTTSALQGNDRTLNLGTFAPANPALLGGRIDDVFVFARALSSGDINELVALGSAAAVARQRRTIQY